MYHFCRGVLTHGFNRGWPDPGTPVAAPVSPAGPLL